MTRLARHALSILVLPVTVVVLVPRWLLEARAGAGLADGVPPAGARVVGALVFLAGLGLFAWCVVLFARLGRGTLAPWDATRRLVTVGPYRHVRNPMITAVAAMLAGEATFFASARLAAWLVLFVLINHAYFVLSEEPGLERRFGAAYREYRDRVPRWLPRLRP